MAVEPRRIAEILLAQNLPASWVATVIDRADRVVARSRQHEAFVGKSAPDEFLRAAREADGIWEGRNLEGTEVSGPMPARACRAGRRSSACRPTSSRLRCAAPSGPCSGWDAALILLSLLLARVFGRRIAAPVQGLVDLAQRPRPRRARGGAIHRTGRDRPGRRCPGLGLDGAARAGRPP